MTAKLLFRLALLGGCFLNLSVPAQQPIDDADQGRTAQAPDPVLKTEPPAVPQDALMSRIHWMPGPAQSYFFVPARVDSSPFEKMSWTSTPGTIHRMESAFYCNDTPFVDQVRIPLATFWRGRVKLIGFESDITTANFVLGLPGQGALHSLSAFGNAFVATHTPPSDQLAGIHMTFSWHGTESESSENSGRRGIEYLVRASRSALPFHNAQSDAARSASR